MLDHQENVAHYSRLEHMEKILKEKHIRLGPVSQLNDPRESSLGWIETCGYGHQLDIEKSNEASKLKESVGENLRLFCTSRFCEEDEISIDTVESKIYGRPRMWAQYGDNSKGFCVILDRNGLSTQIELQAKNPEHIIAGEVEYYDWLSLVGGGAPIEYGKGIPSRKDNIFEIINSNQILKSLYFKKSIDWKAEKEFRWLIYSESKEDTLVPIRNIIKAVVLGWKFPVNRIREVREYCKALNSPCFKIDYQHPKYELYQIS